MIFFKFLVIPLSVAYNLATTYFINLRSFLFYKHNIYYAPNKNASDGFSRSLSRF
jgi:hypothetical protein